MAFHRTAAHRLGIPGGAHVHPGRAGICLDPDGRIVVGGNDDVDAAVGVSGDVGSRRGSGDPFGKFRAGFAPSGQEGRRVHGCGIVGLEGESGGVQAEPGPAVCANDAALGIPESGVEYWARHRDAGGMAVVAGGHALGCCVQVEPMGARARGVPVAGVATGALGGCCRCGQKGRPVGLEGVARRQKSQSSGQDCQGGFHGRLNPRLRRLRTRARVPLRGSGP